MLFSSFIRSIHLDTFDNHVCTHLTIVVFASRLNFYCETGLKSFSNAKLRLSVTYCSLIDANCSYAFKLSIHVPCLRNSNRFIQRMTLLPSAYCNRFIAKICLLSCPFLVPQISATKESAVIRV